MYDATVRFFPPFIFFERLCGFVFNGSCAKADKKDIKKQKAFAFNFPPGQKNKWYTMVNEFLCHETNVR